jgi:hypothetical protein
MTGEDNLWATSSVKKAKKPKNKAVKPDLLLTTRFGINKVLRA